MRALSFVFLLLVASADARAAALAFSTIHGGNGFDQISGSVVLPDDSVVMTGSTDSTDLPTPGGQQTTKGAGVDGFLVKISANNQRVFGRYIQGAGDEFPQAVAVGADNKIYVAGYQRDASGDSNCIVLRFAADGAFELSRIFGGRGSDVCTALAIDASGRIHVTGYTDSTDLPVSANAWKKTNGGLRDALYAVYEPDGTRSYLSYIGAENDQVAHDIKVNSGYAYIVGDTAATPNTQAFVIKINANATFPESGEYVTGIGGSSADAAYGLALDASGAVFVTGLTASTDLPVTPGVFGTAPSNCFVARLGTDGVVQKLGYGEPESICMSITVRGNDVWVGGFDSLVTLRALALRTDRDFATVGASARIRPTATGSVDPANIVARSTGRAVLAGRTSVEGFLLTPDAFQGDQPGMDGFVTEIDPRTPTLSVSDCTVGEGGVNEHPPCAMIASLDLMAFEPVSFRHTAVDGTASVYNDYAPSSAIATIPLGSRSARFDVVVNGDGYDEPDEYGEVMLGEVSGPAVASAARGRFTIVDDDPTPTLSISDCAVSEGTGANSVCTFTVSLAPASAQTVTVAYNSADGSATQPGDYAPAVNGALQFAPGETSKPVGITVIGDALDEDNETLVLNLSAATNATIGDGQGQATLVDNDNPPDLSVDSCSVVEGSSGTASCTFRVRLSASSGKTVSANWAPAFGDAPALGDSFDVPTVAAVTTLGTGQAFGPWTVDAGSIDVIPSTFWSGADGAQSIDLSGAGAATIHADVPVLAAQPYRVHFALAGNAGCGNAVKRMEVRWNGALLGAYAFDTAGHGNANMGWRRYEVAAPAVAGSSARLSFVSLEPSACGPALDDVTVMRSGFAGPGDLEYATGTVTFAPGAIESAPQSLVVNGDTVVEPDETLAIVLYGGANHGTLGAGVVTLLNDDADPIHRDGFE